MSTKKTIFLTIIISFFFSAFFGGIFGFAAGTISSQTVASWLDDNVLNQANASNTTEKVLGEKIRVVSEESAVIEAVQKASPAVASIVITKDVPVFERFYQDYNWDDFFMDPFNFSPFPQYRQKGTEEQEIGGGTGFFVAEDGYLITNKHVVSDEQANYTVITKDGDKYEAEVIARDPTNDIAILKVDVNGFPTIEMGDSDSLQVGQTIIAIGFALGEYENSVSRGVVSGLSRDIQAGDYTTGQSERLEGVIQTDAAINPGNSGGPLLNIDGQAIGVNVAIVQGSENIGFALPINEVRTAFASVQETGKISRPQLGVRYIPITEEIKERNNLSVDYGALVIRGEERGELAVIPGSPADRAGIQENDIILEVDGVRVDEDNTLVSLIRKYKVDDTIEVKLLHKGEEKTVSVILEEIPE